MKEKGCKELELGCDLYEQGRLAEAFREFEIAAKLGNPEAQVNLANMLDEGEGTTRNFTKAVYWYRRAVFHGLAEAAYNLAFTYKRRGNPRWFKFWLDRACSMGYAKELVKPLVKNYCESSD